MKKVFRVHVKFPSGFEGDVDIMPGSPLVFPNRAEPAKDSRVRPINSMEAAIEFANGAFHNQTSPVTLEWPSEVTAVSERDPSKDDVVKANTVVKRLGGDPGKPEGKGS